MDWSNDLILEFLDLYELEQVIWNPKHPDHKNKLRVAEAWENIQRALAQDISVNDLKRKKECLMATYRNLHRKVRESKKSGISDEVYKPSWFCYRRMSKFLRNIYKPRPALDPESMETETQPDTEDSEPLLDECSHHESQINADDENSEGAGRKASKSSVKKRIGNTSHSWEGMVENGIDETYSIPKTLAQKFDQKEDECDVYSKLLAIKLRKLDEQTRDIVMNDIDNLIFRAKMGHTYNQHRQPEQKNQLEHSYTYHSPSPSFKHSGAITHSLNIKNSPSSPNQSLHSRSFPPSPSHSYKSQTLVSVPFFPVNQNENSGSQTDFHPRIANQTEQCFLDDFTTLE